MEIVVQGEHPEDSDSDAEDDDDMSEDMDEDGGEVEIIDELGEHHHHHHHHHHRHDHYESGGEDDWQSDGSDGDQEDEEEEEGMLGDSNLETIARALGVGHDEDPDGMDDREDGFLEDEGDEDDDMEGDEDDEDLEEEEAMMGEDYDEEDEGASGIPWGWTEGDDAPIMTRAQPRGTGGWFTLSGAPRDPPVFSTASLLKTSELFANYFV